MGGEQARWRPGRKSSVTGAAGSARVRALHPPQLLAPLDEPSHLLLLPPTSTPPLPLSSDLASDCSEKITIQRWSSSPH